MSWIVSLLVLSALVFFHELGHYLAARAMGVYVEVFSIGFGKRLFTFHAFDTEWTVSAIPLGGYVRMKGQDDTDPSKRNYDSDSYNVKTPMQRMFILLSGPLANFGLAYVLYFMIALGGPNTLSPVVGEVTKDSPAQVAGLQKNDIIKEIDGHAIDTWNEMASYISNAQGSIDLKVERDGLIEFLTLTPKITLTKNAFNEDVKRKMIGIASAGVTHQLDLGLGGSLSYAWDQTIYAATMIFTGLQKLIMGDVPAKELGGVISIVKLTSDASAAGWMSVFFFTALISVNLGVLNLLPIPALDGGHIMFNLYEFISKRAPSEAILIKMTIAGWVVLFSLMGLGLYNDINRLLLG